MVPEPGRWRPGPLGERGGGGGGRGLSWAAAELPLGAGDVRVAADRVEQLSGEWK